MSTGKESGPDHRAAAKILDHGALNSRLGQGSNTGMKTCRAKCFTMLNRSTTAVQPPLYGPVFMTGSGTAG